MKKNRIVRTLLVLVLLLVAVSATTGAAPAARAGDISNIDRYALNELATNGRASVFIKMASDASLDGAEGISDRTARLQFVYDTLTDHATRSQKAITRFLDNRGVRYQSFWINNSIFISDADLALVQTLARRSDVAYVRGNRQVPLHTPVSRQTSTDAVEGIEWNIQKINAPTVWAGGNTGQGVVVANVDTGVRWTHNALVNQYRGTATGSHEYNWFDPSGTYPTAPGDNNGHGTHTMGTMVGDDGGSNQIGVAPGAQWIATKGCASSSCWESDLIASAQWIACPTKMDGTSPDCSKAPHVVNNSWGGGGGDGWYVSYTNAWLAAGIMPVFSIGNSGSSCYTAGSPGDYRLVIGVGATDSNDVLAYFSSKGPGTFRALKPDFAAPGDNVRSSVNGSNNAYSNYSGTSMAAPHVAGTIALMYAANPAAGLLEIYRGLRNSTVTALGAPPGPDSCGGRAYNVYPNAIYGWGRIDAAGAVAEVTP